MGIPSDTAEGLYWILYWPALDYIERVGLLLATHKRIHSPIFPARPDWMADPPAFHCWQHKLKLSVHHSVIEGAKMEVQAIARRAAEEDFAEVEPVQGSPSNAVPSGIVGHG